MEGAGVFKLGSGPPSCHIQQSAWKGCSENFRFTAF